MKNYRYCVIKIDGKYAGSPCITWEEARELAAQHNGSSIMKLELDSYFGPCACFASVSCPYKSSNYCTHDHPWNVCDYYHEYETEF